jgi:asparagine synthase (glutamine-hydrolysing)
MLAGYETYRARRYAALYGRLPHFLGGRLIPELVRRLPVSHERVSFDFKAKRFVTGAHLAPAAGHLWWKTVLAEDVKAGIYQNGIAAHVRPTVRLFDSLYAESDGAELDRLQYIDAALYLPADLLVKTDRMSMAHSLEARVPFLDRAVVELCRRLPARLRLHGLTTKYLLRRAMRDRLPRPIVAGRKRKRGFNVPMSAWLTGGLRDYARDMLAPGRLKRQGLLDPRAVGRLLDEHLTRKADRNHALWTLLVLVVWHGACVRRRISRRPHTPERSSERENDPRDRTRSVEPAARSRRASRLAAAQAGGFVGSLVAGGGGRPRPLGPPACTSSGPWSPTPSSASAPGW